MGKFEPKTETIRDNYRLVVSPQERGVWITFKKETMTDHSQWLKTLGEIEKEIRRHVDNVDSIQHFWDERKECIHCGYDPEPAEGGCPQCCREAVKDFEEWQKAEAPHDQP
jgi:hypothetical protein